MDEMIFFGFANSILCIILLCILLHATDLTAISPIVSSMSESFILQFNNLDVYKRFGLKFIDNNEVKFMAINTIHPKRLQMLKNRFPKLWANHKEEFAKFFDVQGKMNAIVHIVYDTLKEKRRKRISYLK